MNRRADAAVDFSFSVVVIIPIYVITLALLKWINILTNSNQEVVIYRMAKWIEEYDWIKVIEVTG